MMVNDKTVGRINHVGHRHPDTSHGKRKCREQMIETGKPLKVRGVDPIPPREEADAFPIEEFLTHPAVQEAEASVALDKGEGGTYSVEGAHTAKYMTADEVDAVEPEVSNGNSNGDPRDGLTIQAWGAIIDSLLNAEEWLGQHGDLTYATFHMVVDDVPVAATFNPKVGWKVATR